MDGSGLDDRCCDYGDHHHWPAVDTGSIQHCCLHAAARGSTLGTDIDQRPALVRFVPLADNHTIVIVTHNLQQAARVSNFSL
jgi:hypothetical protein